MIEKMNLINILANESNLDKVISVLLDLGCFEPEEKAIPKTAKNSAYGQNPYAESLKSMREILDYCKITPTGISFENESESEALSRLSFLEERLNLLRKQRDDAIESLSEISNKITALSHFTDLDFDIEKAIHSKYFKVRFGKITRESYKKIEALLESFKFLLFVPCSFDKSFCWGLYAAPVSRVEEADRLFASVFFERLMLPDSTGEPEALIAELTKESEKQKELILEAEKEIDEEFLHHGDEFSRLYNLLKRNYDIFEYKKLAAEYNDKKRMLAGWIPDKDYKKVEESLCKIKGVKLIDAADDAGGKITPPTKLKNWRLFAPFQFFVEIYGVPGYNEIDPTAFFAISYTLLYGVMFADVGQGILLTLIGILMYKLKGMALGKALIPCGIAGTAFGLLFGSVFGYEDLLNPMYAALGFSEKPFPVMENAVNLLAFSVFLGIFLMIVALILGVFSNIKKKAYGEALFGANGLAGLIMYLSILMLVGGMLFNIKLPVSVILIFGVLLPVVLIFFSKPLNKALSGDGFKIENVGDFVLENFFELFEVLLSYFTNTISFLRVGAFVLIHAGMMMAFLALSDMVGGGIAGAVMMIFGNAFVIALEGLLVGIQVLRLEFYEMFSRFYSGDGRPFNPIKNKNGKVLV